MATTITPVVSSFLCGAGGPPANFRRARLVRLKPDTNVFYPSTVFLCDLCEFLSVLCGLRFKALHRKVRKGCAKVAKACNLNYAFEESQYQPAGSSLVHQECH